MGLRMFSRDKQKTAPSPGAASSIDLRADFIELEEDAPSVLSRALTIIGNMQKNGDLHMEGELHGNMRARTVTLSSTAHVIGNISGEHVRCAGRVDGNITGRIVELFSTSQVQGNILHETLAIETGAKLEGNCRRGVDLDKLMDKASEDDGFGPLSSSDKGLDKKSAKRSSRSILGLGRSSGNSSGDEGNASITSRVADSAVSGVASASVGK